MSRYETYLRKIAGEDVDISNMPEPSDRYEYYLKQIAENGGGSVDPEDIAEIVTDWLDDHVDPDTGYVIDNTLLVEGAAADAKKTGDEIADLKSALNDIQTATANDVNKALSPKTVTNGKVTEWQFKPISGGSGGDDAAPVIIASKSGSVASFADGGDSLPVESLVVNINPVQNGTGDPSPSNVRPISGWTGVAGMHTGKNLLNPNATEASTYQAEIADALSDYKANGVYAQGYSSNGTSRSQNVGYWTSFTECKAGVTYTAKNFAGTFSSVCFLDEDGNVISNSNGWVASYTHTALDNEKYIMLGWQKTNAGDVQIEVGSSATAYSPYTGEQIAVEFPTEAGTVYGGTVDVTTGVLTVDRVMVAPTWKGFLAGTYAVANYATLSPVANAAAYNATHGAISNMAKEMNAYWGEARKVDENYPNTYGFAISQNGGQMVLYDADTTLTEETFAAKYADLRIVYPLATPVTYQLTPHEVTTLLGNNNIWADTGDVAVQYRADTKLYVDEHRGSGGDVSDVQISGVSIVSNGVANIESDDLDFVTAVSGSTPTITAVAGMRYECGEVSTIDITTPATGIVDVIFESGSTPAVLTVTPPTGMTMKWANGFDPTALEANTVYELNIMNGVYGVVASWT